MLPCADKMNCSDVKRKQQIRAVDVSPENLEGISRQPSRDDASLTDTSIVSSLTSASVGELIIQQSKDRDIKLKRRHDVKQQYSKESSSEKRSLWDFSIYQQLELMDELLCSLGRCYPRWKHRRFGLQRYYCHKFNIHFNETCRSNYIKLLSNMWEGFESTGIKTWRSNSIWLQLLTQEYQIHMGNSNKQGMTTEYSNNQRVEELLQQLDEIASCFCSDRCSMDFMRHSSYWGNLDPTTIVHGDETVKQPIAECFASCEIIKEGPNSSKINAIVSFYKERGIIHNFTKPYEYKTRVVSTPKFKRSVVCLGCGRICWCSCERKLFRIQDEGNNVAESFFNSCGSSDSETEEITDIHEFVNKLHIKKQCLHHHIAQTAISVAHSREIDGGVVHCYSSNYAADDSMDNIQPKSELKKQLLRATVLRGSLDDVFKAITPRSGDMSLPEIKPETMDEWKRVPPHRSWRKCWWRLIDKKSLDTADANVKSFVARALERLDALGNVRYNLDYGYISVGYLQKRTRICNYWRHFYVSKLGLWKAFTKAVEYNLMMTTLPLEIQLDIKSMQWIVSKCHQGDMHRKSFSTLKHGLNRGYALGIMWFESFMRDIQGSCPQNSDIEEESDVGCDDFEEQLFLKKDAGLYEGVNTVERAYSAARKRKIVLTGEKGYDEGRGTLSRVAALGGDLRGIACVKEQLMLDHNLWYKDLSLLFPSVSHEGFAPPEPAQYSTLRDLLNHYPSLRDYFTLSLKHLDECVYTLRMCVNNTLTKGNMDLVETILHLNDDRKLADVIPQIPMQWVSFHKNSDSWTCVLECKVCLTCAPRSCSHQNDCMMFQNSKDVIGLLCKKFNPCSVKYSAHPFYKDSPGNSVTSKDVIEDCCIVGFSAQKFGFNGAKALATEFRKRFLQIVYSSIKYDGSFTDALLGMIAEEVGLLTSTDAYILSNLSSEEQRQNLIDSLSCGICSEFGDRMQHRNGTVLLKQLVKSSVPGRRLCDVFALGQMAHSILYDVKLDIRFCYVHMAWVVWWLDCMQQKRVMFYRVEDLISVTSLEEELSALERHWTDAVCTHVEYQHRPSSDTYQPNFVYRFEEAFRHLTCLQKNLYDAFHTAFAMALRAIADSRQEYKLIRRLWQINKGEPGNVLAHDMSAKSFSLGDAVIFPFGALHDEGTPPLSDAE